jgi:hypothetical protein
VRILVLAPQPFYIERGTPIDVDLLLRALSERGHEVDALVYPRGQDRTYPNVRVHRVRAPRGLSPARPGFSLGKIICDVAMLRTAVRLARERRPDVVHAGEEAVFIAWYLRRRYGLPYVYDMDSSIAQQLVEQYGHLRPLQRLLSALERRGPGGGGGAAPGGGPPAAPARAAARPPRGAAHGP